ncbi:MAG: hypothetical protein ACPGYV_07125, partial [Phycisphaeraceae bacterium]
MAQLVAALLPLAVVLGLLDYALRMPGTMRLMIVLLAVGFGGYWLLTRLNRALRFWPSLAELALRAERLYPQLAGSLASAVEFSMQPKGDAVPGTTATMTQTAIDQMNEKTAGVDVKRMVKLKPTVQALACALLGALVIAAIATASGIPVLHHPPRTDDPPHHLRILEGSAGLDDAVAAELRA